ncbi:uncharacterized protein LOC120667377 isoform X2 [Panicum virgatum]|uniref:uncharacterized protein LOC120667377 isoform X2 n=1 Tax=Panicum virgatum TaxID=38727 RepID=UPI0019D6565A|nr:uncharacterized protein LOC120667377 isoform X2 [Panicum virgatum]
MLDPKTYIPESNEPELTRINEQMDIANADLVINFQRTCKVAEIFDRDLQNYELQVPRCPKHSNSPFQKFDSGIFAMLLMYNWNGSVIKIFDHTEATKFRKLIAYKLMNSDLNEAAIKNNQTEDQP